MTKKEIRKYMLNLRKNVTDRIKKDKAIALCLLSQDFYKNAKTIMTYISYGSEVDTHALIFTILKDKKTLCAPKCVTECDIEARAFSDFSGLSKGAFGILEPDGALFDNFDLIIVPGVAFNTKNYRIGYGRGYYDRFLKGNDAITVGLFYEEQRSEFLPDKNDIALDYIITEKNLYKREL